MKGDNIPNATEVANKTRIQPRCSRCGSIDVNMQYCNGGITESGYTPYACEYERKGGHKESHHCHCRTCHYEWDESCIPPQGEQSAIRDVVEVSREDLATLFEMLGGTKGGLGLADATRPIMERIDATLKGGA